MNSKHLGDVFDHWKGSVIQRLMTAKSKNLLKNITVVPMITPDHWSSKERRLYADLLNVELKSILPLKKEIFNDSRDDYFDKISPNGDLFLDPDTGVGDVTGKRRNRYITPKEIRKLLTDDGSNERVILIYQHGAQGQSSENRQERLENIVGKVLHMKTDKRESTLHEYIFNCNHAAILFFSYNGERIKKIKAHLKAISPKTQ